MSSQHVLFGFIFGGFRSVVKESDVQIARPTGILRNPGPQGGQARPRDSGAVVHFEPGLSDVPEEVSSVGAPSRESSRVPSPRPASVSSASDSSASATSVPALLRSQDVPVSERSTTPELEHERPIREPHQPSATTEEEPVGRVVARNSPLRRLWGI